MVLQVNKWNIHPDKIEAYLKWAETAIKRTITTKVGEFRAYRSITGDSQVMTTYQFSDIASWAEWQGNEDVQKVMNELRTLALNINMEVWGASPIAPTPVYYY